ncbi:hypothetical protein CGZ94_13805 [Enemella evansiae]|uniref:ABC transmembrane type-1 domain-containing protein n=1 Tax=Enemella evansiae TaxID=2016499 RepID=A0A255GBL1_9ACTN|nr:ABC transporter permease [Enemella evansiae]OYO12951.1 hypothetical protein CGZ94_13805 [Enemella evansiae]
MTRVVASRLVQLLVVVWLVATITFFVFRVLPGDPTVAILGLDASPEARAALRAQMGLDRPLLLQYVSWLGGLLRGDLGVAYSHGSVPVAGLIWQPLGRTLILAVSATVLAVLVSVPLSMLAAVKRGSLADGLTRALAVTGFSLPSFWLGMLLLLLFSQYLGWLPAGGYVPFTRSPLGFLRSLILPTVAVSFILTGIFVRFLRSSLIDQLDEDYIRTSRAKGVKRGVLWYRHALRNALIPFITVVGIQFGLLIGGLVVVEQVFNWPGIGLLMVQGILLRGFEVVQAGVLITAVICVLVNMAVDLTYRFLDPRTGDA